jgi:hypothetical protein
MANISFKKVVVLVKCHTMLPTPIIVPACTTEIILLHEQIFRAFA